MFCIFRVSIRAVYRKTRQHYKAVAAVSRPQLCKNIAEAKAVGLTLKETYVLSANVLDGFKVSGVKIICSHEAPMRDRIRRYRCHGY